MMPTRTAASAIVVLSLTAALGGCAGGPPIRFFTLAPVPPASTSRTSGPPVQVTAVHIPDALDRHDLVRQTSANGLQLDELHHWAGPLDAMVQNVLTRDLIRRLDPERVVLPQESAPKDTGRLVIDVLRFMPAPDGTVIFDGGWSLLRAGEPPANHPLHLSETARAGDAEDQARAMSAILGRIADAIAAALPADSAPAD